MNDFDVPYCCFSSVAAQPAFFDASPGRRNLLLPNRQLAEDAGKAYRRLRMLDDRRTIAAVAVGLCVVPSQRPLPFFDGPDESRRRQITLTNPLRPLLIFRL